jgi:hypothetical protein
MAIVREVFRHHRHCSESGPHNRKPRNTRVFGEGGNDIVSFLNESGNDTISGGDANDRIGTPPLSPVVPNGNPGNDVVTGSAGDDVIGVHDGSAAMTLQTAAPMWTGALVTPATPSPDASGDGEVGAPVTVVPLPGRRSASGRPQGRP